MKIAICISTRNRNDILMKSYKEWCKFLPDKAEIFVVDDASEKTFWDIDYRFPERAGIPRVKNKCIELSYDWGADHFFLADDDCYPIAPFADAYINSGINHLSFSFQESYEGATRRKGQIIKDGFKIHKTTNGCMLYFTRKCFDTVGGFDTRYGYGMYEHNELTRRIYNAGLTPYPNMDIIGSEKLFYSLDMHGEVKRSFDARERRLFTNKYAALYNATRKSKEFIDFREKITI